MDPKTRKIALGSVLAGVLGLIVVRPVFMAPLNDAEKTLESAERRLEQAEERNFRLLQAREHISNAQAVSLPPSLNDAQRLYQEWITDLALECRFAPLQISPGRREQRSGRYLAVGIELEAEADLKDLSRFLFQFEQADLVHRISSLRIESTGTSGKPRMEFELTAEGLSVTGCSDKTELAARTDLKEALDAETSVLSVADSQEFPSKTPFLAKIGAETIRVAHVAENTWTVERSVGGSQAREHPAGSIVRHFPVAWDRQERSFDEYQEFLTHSLFTKPLVPRTYRPKIAGLSTQTIPPGATATVTARVDDYNVDIGEISFGLQNPQEGMQIDPVTGQFKWETPDDIELTDYTVGVFATQRNNDDLTLIDEFVVRVRLPNEAPKLNVEDSAVVLLGQPFRLKPSASDDGDGDDLTYSLEGDTIPEGLSLDAKTGVITWAPPLSFTPGPQSVTLKVTDQGDPPQSAGLPIQLLVRDDDARFTRFSGSVRKDGRPEAWFENIRTKSQTVLQIGDRLEIADIAAEIIGIEARLVTLRDDGGIWQLALGNRVRDRVLSEPAEEQDTASPPVAERADVASPVQ